MRLVSLARAGAPATRPAPARVAGMPVPGQAVALPLLRGPGAPRPVRPTLHARPAPVAVRAEPSSVALSEPEPEIDQAAPAPSPPPSSPLQELGATALSLGLLYATDTGLKKVFLENGIAFPAPLAGMFAIIGALIVLATVAGDEKADAAVDWFRPGLDWLARWLPLFYVPSLVVAPVAIAAVPASQLTRIVVLVVVGMAASLAVTAQTTVAIRGFTNTTALPPTPSKPKPGFTNAHSVAWGAAAAASFALVAAGVPGVGVVTPESAFMLSATVGGLLVGSAMPAGFRQVVHPVLTMALIAMSAGQALAWTTGVPLESVFATYLAKGKGPMGAGDLLMSFLGCVILSFGFRIFEQRAIMRRHFVEIVGGCTASALFGLFSSAAAARALGLSPDLALSVVPRSVTVALALPIATQLGATQLSVTATAVMLTGLLGASCAQILLDKLGYKDPIVRGMATAGSSHGLGTAALAAKEPEALPYCALAYAVIGILATVFASLPPVRAALIAICGA